MIGIEEMQIGAVQDGQPRFYALSGKAQRDERTWGEVGHPEGNQSVAQIAKYLDPIRKDGLQSEVNHRHPNNPNQVAEQSPPPYP